MEKKVARVIDPDLSCDNINVIACTGCQRHYRIEDRRCPFCTTRLRTSPAIGAVALVLGLGLLACSDSDGDGDSVDTTADTGSSDMGSTDTGDSTTDSDTSFGTEYAGPPPGEWGEDTETDTETESSTETDTETESSTETDTETESSTGSDTESESDSMENDDA